MQNSVVKLRADLLRTIRKHFLDNFALEVQCTSLQSYRSYMPNTYHLNQNAATGGNPEIPVVLSDKNPAKTYYLAPFHEHELRALLHQEKSDVYSIQPCFRHEEDVSHLYCFHMIEWARASNGKDEGQLLFREPQGLLTDLFSITGIDLPVPQVVPFSHEKFTAGESQVPAKGFFANNGFPELYEYPSPRCTSFQQDRVEYFYDGIEIANVFMDNTSGRDFLMKWPDAPAGIVKMTEQAPATVCGAIGLERLLMAMTGEKDIQQCLADPFYKGG